MIVTYKISKAVAKSCFFLFCFYTQKKNKNIFSYQNFLKEFFKLKVCSCKIALTFRLFLDVFNLKK